MTQTLRPKAERVAQAFPGLLARADRLASTLSFGEHGRLRAGAGDAFWQFRRAEPGDDVKFVDWRRSARSDEPYVRQTEWQLAQLVLFWVDPSQSMQFGSNGLTKYDRASVLALATAILLSRQGERFGFAGGDIPSGTGSAQLERLEFALTSSTASADYGIPNVRGMRPGGRIAFFSDFFGDLNTIERAVNTAAARGVGGVFCMTLDPVEAAFPFKGRTKFESMSGALTYESQQAQGVAGDYKAALADRQNALVALAKTSGWRFVLHHTGDPAIEALTDIYGAIGGQG